jgi:hypothetical protein
MAIILRQGVKVLVCGGRHYHNRDLVFTELDKLHTAKWIGLIINGGAGGADKLAREWARSNKIPIKTYIAEWDRYGRKAGPIRNQLMLDDAQPDIALAFPGNNGTADMVRRIKAKRPRVQLIEIRGSNE